jgi:hypothetical protein
MAVHQVTTHIVFASYPVIREIYRVFCNSAPHISPKNLPRPLLHMDTKQFTHYLSLKEQGIFFVISGIAFI